MAPKKTVTVVHSYAGEIAALSNDYLLRGQKQGRENRPPSDARGPDENEVSLELRANAAVRREQQLFESVVTEAARNVDAIRQEANNQSTVNARTIMDDSLRGKARIDLGDSHSRLVSDVENRLRKEADYNYFRQVNGIVDEPRYPESLVWHMALIALLALIETGMNAFFFENAQGLLGGFVVALGVSIVNIGLALLLGVLFRYKNLKSPGWRALGWASLLVFVVEAVYCNALFAAYRSTYQLVQDPDNVTELRRAFTEALGQAGGIFYLHAPFPDLTSFVLFLFGLLLTAFAFYKGYTLDDRYPGHGAKHRLLLAAKAPEEAMKQAVRQKLGATVHGFVNSVQEALHRPAQLQERLGKVAAEVDHAQRQLGAEVGLIRRDFSLVLTGYRKGNTAVRTTAAPAHFAVHPELDAVSDQPARDLLDEINKVRLQIDALRTEFEEPLNRKFRDVQKEAPEILTTMFKESLEQAHVEAVANIDQRAHIRAMAASAPQKPPSLGAA